MLYTWDLDQLSTTFLGVPIDGQYGEGGAISFEPDSSDWLIKKGMQRVVTRYRSGDRVVKATVRLAPKVPLNAIFSAIVNAERASTNGAGVGPFVSKDTGGTFSCTEGAAFIEGIPAIDLRNEATDREWVIWLQGPFLVL